LISTFNMKIMTMLTNRFLSKVLLLLCLMLITSHSQAQVMRFLYDANGNYKDAPSLGDIAHWKFGTPQPENDLSGNNHTLKLRGKDSSFKNGALVVEEKA